MIYFYIFPFLIFFLNWFFLINFNWYRSQWLNLAEANKTSKLVVRSIIWSGTSTATIWFGRTIATTRGWFRSTRSSGAVTRSCRGSWTTGTTWPHRGLGTIWGTWQLRTTTADSIVVEGKHAFEEKEERLFLCARNFDSGLYSVFLLV